jgi:hypothetical protein
MVSLASTSHNHLIKKETSLAAREFSGLSKMAAHGMMRGRIALIIGEKLARRRPARHRFGPSARQKMRPDMVALSRAAR